MSFTNMDRARRRCVLAIAVTMTLGTAMAQDKYPSRAIRIVVGSEAGSAPDMLARAVANEMAPLLGQAVVVENKAGAAGTIGAALVAASPADGYTLLMGTVSNVALAPSFYPVKYDPNKSFTPIGLVASVPLVLVASPNLGAQTFSQLKDKAHQSPSGQLSYASPGVGGPQHLAGVLLQRSLGTEMLHVPYKSGGAAMVGVSAGDVSMAFAGIPAAAALAQSKRVHPLFVTSQKRSPALPEVMSATEAGMPDFVIDNWHAIFAPANLPAPIRSVLEAALQKSLHVPAVVTQFQKGGADAAPGTGAQLGSMVASETQRWSKVVMDNKLKAE